MGPGSHVILMLLWARKEDAKHMVRVHADGTEEDSQLQQAFPATQLTAFLSGYLDSIEVSMLDCQPSQGQIPTRADMSFYVSAPCTLHNS